MSEKTQSDPSSSMSLVSRLDHLEFIMKYLERKQTLAKLESNNGSTSAGGELKKKQCMPVDLALKESYFKGSLMDRVASLENRLFQLCIEKESSSSSSTSTQASSGETYWSHQSKGESSCSLPTFNSNINPFHLHNIRLSQIPTTRPDIQEQPDGENVLEQKKMSSGSPAQRNHRKNKKKKATRANKDEKSLKTEKRISSISWPHLKLLGC
ncbi:uncharacterized protein LOC126795538 [Argentina anserina]|uniref:uncharacterized protein LOC126795538 n=1 Tax=Argentina anserina TaxID=57926 RepID=UPI0021767126|nr:uncharacterized protein LOC126795538 [Potentilla anserina]